MALRSVARHRSGAINPVFSSGGAARNRCRAPDVRETSEQIEQINIDEKKNLEDLERFGRFIRLMAHQLVSAQPTEGVFLAAQ